MSVICRPSRPKKRAWLGIYRTQILHSEHDIVATSGKWLISGEYGMAFWLYTANLDMVTYGKGHYYNEDLFIHFPTSSKLISILDTTGLSTYRRTNSVHIQNTAAYSPTLTKHHSTRFGKFDAAAILATPCAVVVAAKFDNSFLKETCFSSLGSPGFSWSSSVRWLCWKPLTATWFSVPRTVPGIKLE